MSGCSCTEKLTIHWVEGWEKGGLWNRQEVPSMELRGVDALSSVVKNEAEIFIVLASANKIRDCEGCRDALIDMFQMPRSWWSEHERKSNGQFGCMTKTDDQESIVSMNTWARFLVKKLLAGSDYRWYKINVFIRWLGPQQTTILLFDAPAGLEQRVPHELLAGLSQEDLRDPFWVYGHLVEEVVVQQSETVWDNRTRIRTIEKGGGKLERSQDFSALNDLARHAIHISETLGLGVKTMACMLRDHSTMRTLLPGSARAASRRIHERLNYLEHLLEGQRQRAASNKQRLDQGMQLAFHTVTQMSADRSLEMSKSMREDSAAMKTVADLTLTFLPATFICAVFSMSFFSNEPGGGGWMVSDKMWLYWAITAPVTLATWLYMQRGWKERFKEWKKMSKEWREISNEWRKMSTERVASRGKP
ncbi:hypothetical protein B0I35DRAFT_69019 [Stachybotrys elegans]|uniref:Uncharacterized protein n=1 Tax=Stachybotrys elegans TaxID=80388 RepID=A0A8K0WPW2_9HYPO|nr:hypothetical protein B0I35DRAFT_69019 [Stachybotrys elegans]